MHKMKILVLYDFLLLYIDKIKVKWENSFYKRLLFYIDEIINKTNSIPTILYKKIKAKDEIDIFQYQFDYKEKSLCTIEE